MKTFPSVGATMIVLSCLAMSPALRSAVPDFSGNYTLKTKKKSSSAEVWTMHVVETPSAVKVTRNMGGHVNSNIYPLAGVGRYVSDGGKLGTCQAKIKGSKLFLESLVVARPVANGPPVRVRTRERWELSKDRKTLKVRTDVDFPGSGLGAYSPVEPSTDTYMRN